jgi:hypothetical protein
VIAADRGNDRSAGVRTRRASFAAQVRPTMHDGTLDLPRECHAAGLERSSTAGLCGPAVPGAASMTSGDEFLRATLPALDLVHNLARRLLPGRADAEDLVQETYLRAWQAWTAGPAGRALAGHHLPEPGPRPGPAGGEAAGGGHRSARGAGGRDRRGRGDRPQPPRPDRAGAVDAARAATTCRYVDGPGRVHRRRGRRGRRGRKTLARLVREQQGDP